MKFLLAICTAAVTFGAMQANAATLNLDSIDGVQDSTGEYVGPYNGRVDNVSYLIFCNDLNHNIGVPDSEQVNVSTISDLSQTRFGALTGALSSYEQIFLLSSYSVNASNSDRADIQDAIWSYFANNAPNQSSSAVQGWETLAANNYQNKDYSGFRILTDASNQFNGKQELFIDVNHDNPGLNQTPEPGTWALLMTGVGGIVVARTRRVKV